MDACRVIGGGEGGAAALRRFRGHYRDIDLHCLHTTSTATAMERGRMDGWEACMSINKRVAIAAAIAVAG